MDTKLSRTAVLENLLEGTQPLQARVLDNGEIRKIPTEALARYTYRSNASLQAKHPGEELFIAHWKGQRLQGGLDATTQSGDIEATLREEWNRTPALRAEFFDNFDTYRAFVRASAQGGVRIVNSPVLVGGRHAS